MTDPRMRSRRTVHSFVRRSGRTTSGQHRAIAELWTRYGLEAGTPVDFDQAFGRRAPRVLEIGFGDGGALMSRAAAEPDRDFLGVEVHAPGIGHCLRLLAARGLLNVRLMREDVLEILERCIAPSSLAEVVIWFPDPWPKKRHHKRRLVQAPFAALVRSRLAPGGRLRIASDWEPYASDVLELLTHTPGLENAAPAGGFVPRPADRPPTKFEERGQKLGHRVRDLEFRRAE